MPESRTRTAVEAWEQVFRLQATLLRRFDAQDVWGGMSVREYDVLYTLARSGGRCRLGGLSEEVYLPQPSLSRLVDRLVARGLLTREPDPRDPAGDRWPARGRDRPGVLGPVERRARRARTAVPQGPRGVTRQRQTTPPPPPSGPCSVPGSVHPA